MKALLLAAALTASLGRATVVAAPPAAAGSGFDLVFADEFNGTSLDSMKGWIDAYPWGRTHNHVAYMAPENVIFAGDGALTLRAERVAQGGEPFTSGAISTGYTNYKVNGGYIEARILLPTTPGSWPAFWGLDSGWPPEADIMEYPLTTDGGTNGYVNTDYHTAFHYTNGSGNAAAGAGEVNPASAGNLGGTYHTFGMHWVEDTSVTFYFDGVQVSSFTNSAVNQMTSMYLILNYGVGGWPGTPSLAQWPAGHVDETKIDYVRIWQQRAGGASTASTWNINGGGSWDTSGNWSGIVPKYSGQQATFGTVGAAATAAASWSGSRTVGGITFAGGATTTAYTLGSGSGSLQLAGSGGTANAFIEALATSQANQMISSRVELYNNTDIRNNMTGGQVLILNSLIVGDGDLSVDGIGTVQFSNNNTYTGNTTIDPGGQGPAVARVTRSRPFGTAGTVNLGPSGNATTARIEIQDGRDVPSPMNFGGRNNTSVGIENLSGNNSFSGTISAQVGGSSYIIQSDAGLLTLSGAATGAGGVALRIGATGARTFTLQGGGDGAVSGVIQNGTGTVSMTKAGLGTWTLSAANTYTGATTLSGGTLAITGSIASGGTLTTASGTTLTGSGAIGAGATVNGTHSPGTGVGTQTFGSTLAYGTTAHLAWELSGNTAAAGGFDGVTAAGAVTIGSGAAVDIVFNGAGSAVAMTDTFWTQAHSWPVVTGASIGGTFALGTIGSDSAGRAAANYGAFALQHSATAVTLTFTPYPPQQVWQRVNFGANWNNATFAGDTADPEHDGLGNMLEYVLASDPNAPSPAAAPHLGTAGGKLALTFTRNTAATDLTLTVVGANSPAGSWTDLARSTGGAAFTAIAAGATATETGIGATRTVEVRDIYLTTDPAHPLRFLRLQVQH